MGPDKATPFVEVQSEPALALYFLACNVFPDPEAPRLLVRETSIQAENDEGWIVNVRLTREGTLAPRPVKATLSGTYFRNRRNVRVAKPTKLTVGSGYVVDLADATQPRAKAWHGSAERGFVCLAANEDFDISRSALQYVSANIRLLRAAVPTADALGRCATAETKSSAMSIPLTQRETDDGKANEFVFHSDDLELALRAAALLAKGRVFLFGCHTEDDAVTYFCIL